ncbi:MAG: hypothetical protein JXP73_01500 [Deltaproteobacteria bacterium]|nr:hypothetical protein [Deltaproteobacteria bacterium]
MSLPPSLRRAPTLVALALASLSGCDLAYPEVVVVNRTADTMLLRNPSFSGCIWPVVLANGDATSPGRCLPGDDRVHFKRLNAETYCQDEAQDRTLPGVCPCDGGVAPELDAGDVDADVNTQPMWFNYQTVSSKHVGYGGFYLFEITLDDMEQDFSIPGPYGH